MMNYKPVTEEVLEALRKAVGAEYVMTDPETLDKYKTALPSSAGSCCNACQYRRSGSRYENCQRV